MLDIELILYYLQAAAIICLYSWRSYAAEGCCSASYSFRDCLADTESLLVSDGHALKKLRPNVFYQGTVCRNAKNWKEG